MFNLANTIYAFYINEFIYGMLMKEKDTSFLKSHEKFREEFLFMRERFNTILSHVLHDYIILVAARELTSSYRFCEFTIEKFFGYDIWYCYDNDRLIEDNFHTLHIPSFIEICEEIFHNSYWNHRLFGGEMWWTAIRYVRDIYPKDKVLFIDSVIDLQHNTSTLFNKPNPWFISCRRTILEFLDKRKKITDIYELFAYLICQGYGSRRDRCLAQFYRRFAYLYLPDFPLIDDMIFTYIPTIPTEIHETWERGFWNTKPTIFTGEYRQYNIVDPLTLPDIYSEDDCFYC